MTAYDDERVIVCVNTLGAGKTVFRSGTNASSGSTDAAGRIIRRLPLTGVPGCS